MKKAKKNKLGKQGNGGAGKILPSHGELTAALKAEVKEQNGGLGFNMWATVVNRDGEVCAVTFSGGNRGDQWPGSRVISAQKANTANAFSLPGFALSTANLFSIVQPGGSLFGLQHSNPVNIHAAFEGNPKYFGQSNDPMVGERIGGVNVFGGGLALYNKKKQLVGALGISGDASCTDHIIAWKLRHRLKLDNVPAGVSPTKDDNIIHDLVKDQTGQTTSASGFGHPTCDDAATEIAKSLPTTHPTGS